MARFLLVWFYSGNIRAAVAETYKQARKYAVERNAIVIETFGDGVDFGRVEDWYRRSEKGEPLPAMWRDLKKQPQRLD